MREGELRVEVTWSFLGLYDRQRTGERYDCEGHRHGWIGNGQGKGGLETINKQGRECV